MFWMGLRSDILFNSVCKYSQLCQNMFWIWFPTPVKNHVNVCVCVFAKSFILGNWLKEIVQTNKLKSLNNKMLGCFFILYWNSGNVSITLFFVRNIFLSFFFFLHFYNQIIDRQFTWAISFRSKSIFSMLHYNYRYLLNNVHLPELCFFFL